MTWWADYIGLPFKERGRDRDGCDCWGLVRMVYAEQLGIELPTLDGYVSVRDGQWIGPQLEKALPDWEPCEPEAFAVPLFRFSGGKLHVGIVVDPIHMLHIEAGKDACLEPMKRMGNLLSGYYRPRIDLNDRRQP